MMTIPAGMKVGYARCFTDKQDLTAQRHTLLGLGVDADHIYLEEGLTGTHRDRPGLAQALAAVRAGDELVVPKLDRLARSVPDARAIGDDLVKRGVKLSIGGSIYDPADPMGKMFFNILATFAEFEVDLLKLRTREGLAVAKAKGKLKGKQPKLSRAQQAHLVKLHDAGFSTTGTPSGPGASRRRHGTPRCSSAACSHADAFALAEESLVRNTAEGRSHCGSWSPHGQPATTAGPPHRAPTCHREALRRRRRRPADGRTTTVVCAGASRPPSCAGVAGPPCRHHQPPRLATASP